MTEISVPKLHVRHLFGRVRPRTWRLKASWTRPSSYFKRSGPTKLPNQERSPFRLGQRTVCRRTWRFEESLAQTKARSVVDVRADMVRNSEHCLFLSQHFFLRSRYPVSLQPNLLLRS